MISIVLPYRNAASTLAEAAGSVLADMANDDELLLVDDGSTDASPMTARELAADQRVVCVSAGGIGIAGALRCGIAAARGEWIARMDGDDVSLPGRLRAEREVLEAHPRVAVVATRVEAFGNVTHGVARYVAWQNALLSPLDHEHAIFVESPVCHPSTMLRRRALEEIGGFIDGPFAEDYDLWLRLVAAGWQIAKVDRVLLRWRIHERNATWTDPRLSIDNLRRLRARYLARHIDGGGRSYGIWGAGREGRRLAAALDDHGARVSFFLDIDPLKIGRVRRGAPVLTVDAGLERARRDGALVVVAVAVAGARDIVRARLVTAGFAEGRDFVFAA